MGYLGWMQLTVGVVIGCMDHVMGGRGCSMNHVPQKFFREMF